MIVETETHKVIRDASELTLLGRQSGLNVVRIEIIQKTTVPLMFDMFPTGFGCTQMGNLTEPLKSRKMRCQYQFGQKMNMDHILVGNYLGYSSTQTSSRN